MARLSKVGEKAIVRSIASMLHTSARLGPGDDAAAVEIGDRYLVVSTDLLWEGTHFHPNMTWRQKGWMAAAVNLSDIAAMGAQPLGLLLAMGLPADLDEMNVKEMVQGAADCCDQFGTDYLGGDTKECSELVLTGTSLGLVPKDGLLARKGARLGDLLLMTGTAGMASAGLLALEKGLEAPKAVKALFEPLPCIKEGTLLSSSGAVTSCTDTSDGISTSLRELADASGVVFEVDVEALPIDPEVRNVAQACSEDAETIALHGGGDYQLLFTVRPDGLAIIKDLLGGEVTVIGRCLEGKVNTLKRGPSNIILEPRGYEHFRR
ncbi:MAG: thiamine-phosphate kinase [Methanomassiliicoccales archaeon]|nr:thiamine-phosphate kinase [Methanomassiliicoccales archaeon]